VNPGSITNVALFSRCCVLCGVNLLSSILLESALELRNQRGWRLFEWTYST
jgi:hypothetical protein